jgi:aspartate racemase
MNRPGDRIIGVLGGMGPMAGAWFMQRLVSLTPAQDDSEHVPAILVNDPRVPDRVAPILGRGADPLPAMLAGVTRLEAAGAGAVAIACNTAHR